MANDKTISAECRFCGQMVILTDEDDLINAEESATMKCTCKEGKSYRDETRDLEAADENIELLFVKFSDETREFLKISARAVRRHEVDRVTAKISEDTTATIKLKGSDHISVERRKTEKDTLETL